MAKTTSVIVNELYPKVETAMNKNINKFKQCMSRFMENRSKDLFDTAPCERIYYGKDDMLDLCNSIGIDLKDVALDLRNTYYYSIAAFKPSAAKDPLTILVICIVRYFFMKKDQKNLELACIYFSFSGKFYPSIHYGSFPKVVPYRYVMDYVVNNMLTQKFDLQITGSVIGSIKSLGLTWLNTYDRLFVSFDDEDITYLIQQLHTRIKAFMKNIATLYYKAYEDKTYLTYDSDSMDDNDYRLADSDSFKAERTIEKTMEKINSTSIDYKLCKMASDANIRTEELKTILETIISDRESILEVKEVVRILIYTYFADPKSSKDVRDISFITFCIAPKPNTKDKNILRLKEIIESWLDETSPAYRKRKSRLATKNSYNKAVLLYFVLLINTANR